MHRLMRTNGTGEPPRSRVRAVPEAPPHDLHLEREILNSCLHYPELLDGVRVAPADFYSAQNGELFATLLDMRAGGEVVDSLTLRTKLHDQNRLARLGGDEYLLSVTDTLPQRSVPFAQLRKLARKRDVHELAHALSVAARANEDTGPAFEALERARIELDAIGRSDELPSLAAIVESLTFDPRRVRATLPTLDAALRGGLAPGKMAVLVGAPGSCKTSLAAWLCSEAELQGACAMYIASDEHRDGIITRIGQQHGLDRDALESPMPAARQRLARDLREHRPNLHIIDPVRDRLPLEEAARKLAASADAQGKLAVLVVDSLQTVYSVAQPLDDSERGRLNAVINSCRTIADRGLIVIAISEMNRGGYRSLASAQENSPLASGAGSSRIEYGADLQLSLAAVAHEPGHVDVTVNKNRIGSDKPSFRMRIDFARATFAETAPPPVDPRPQTALGKLEQAKERVRNVVRRHRQLKSQRDVLAVCDGNRTTNADAFRAMVNEGELQVVDGSLRLHVGEGS